MKLKISYLLLAGALLATVGIPAQANNDAMLNLLKVLRDKGTISASDYDSLLAAAQSDEEQAAEVVEKIDKVAESTTVVSVKNGNLKVKSTEGDFSVQVGGRIMADYAIMDEDDLGGTGSASEFRRARLFVKGTLFSDWAYKSQLDFAGNKTTIKDMYLQYNGWKPAKFTLGNHKMPFGLDELTSSKYSTFIERSAASNAFAISRQNGLSISTHGSNWTLTGAAHMDNINGTNSGQDEDFGYGARVTFSPIASKTSLVHLGAAFHHQELETVGGDTKQIKLRPEVHTAGKIFKSVSGTFEDYDTYGLEAAAVFGAFSAQAEYLYRSFNAVSGEADQDLNAWYAYASYFLTGESRAYKTSSGVFSRVTPKGIVGKGGMGAWEIGLRYSDIDLEDNSAGSKGDIFTVGLNWYATPNIRFMANYTSADVEGESDDFDSFHFRGQVDF